MNPTGLDLPPLATAFVFGLLGGAHCIGMCGGIMSALSFAVPPSLRHPARLTGLLLGYNLGRITSYAAAGALAAGLGTLVGVAPGARLALQVLAAAMLILMALYIADWWKGLLRVEAIGKRLWRHLEPVGRRLMPVVKVPQAVALGAIWGWLPCGLVYSMLAWSLASADAARGAAMMAAFGLGTLPALLATGLAARRLATLIRHPATRSLAAVAIIGFAVWQLWGLRPGGMDHGGMHAGMAHGTEHADMAHGTEHADMAHGTEHSDMAHGTEHTGMAHGTEHADMTHGQSPTDGAHGGTSPDESHDAGHAGHH